MQSNEHYSLLIVDDEEDILDFLSMSLETLPYEIHAATSGEEALKVLDRQKIQLVITDFKMKGMDGFDLIEQVQAKNPRTVVIIVTGQPDKEMIFKAIKMQVYDFLEKPFDKESLKESVRSGMELYKERHTVYCLAREAVLRYFNFEDVQEFEELDEVKKRELMKKVKGMIS